jgi:4-amino-4-deoxy-L-arabinose transferase-like glycosyltransferase
VLWASASLAACGSAMPRGWPDGRSIVGRVVAARVELLCVGGLLLVALVLRVWDLEHIPYVFSGDEGTQGTQAIHILSGRLRDPFAVGALGQPTMTFFWQAPWIWAFGPTVTGVRLPWAIIGTVSILTTYLLVRSLVGRTVAAATAVFLVGYDFHLSYSRLGLNNIADPFFCSLTLWLLVRGLTRRRPLEFALAGAVAGGALYLYTGARLVAVVAGLWLGYSLLTSQWLRSDGRPAVAAFVFAALVSAAPMISFAVRQPDDFNARMNQVGILQSGWLEREQAVKLQGPVPILFDQFQRAALAFNRYSDRGAFFMSPYPLMQPPASILFGLGLIYATIRFRDRRLYPFVAWHLAGTVLGGMLTESPPSSQRLITLAPTAAFFVALALDRIIVLARSVARIGDSLAYAPALLAAALAFSTARYYFVDYTPKMLFGSYNGLVATELARYLDAAGTSVDWYFAGPPRMFWGFPTVPFLAPDAAGHDLLQPLTRPIAPVEPSGRLLFVLLPERLNELQWIQATYPTGTRTDFPSPLRPEPLFVVWEPSG